MIKVGEMRKVGFSIEGFRGLNVIKKICFIYSIFRKLKTCRL